MCQSFLVRLWDKPGHLPPAAGSLWQCYSLLNKDEAMLQWVSGELSPVINSKYKTILHACKQLGSNISSAAEYSSSSSLC